MKSKINRGFRDYENIHKLYEINIPRRYFWISKTGPTHIGISYAGTATYKTHGHP